MRNPIVELVQRACARMPLLLGVLVALTTAGSAMAGRERAALTTRDGAGLPATPEPGAAIAFAVGIGVVAWAVRRNRNR